MEFCGSCEPHWNEFGSYYQHNSRNSKPSAMTLSAFVSEIPLINIICRLGLYMLDGFPWIDVIRIGNALNSVVTCFDELLYIPCRDSIALFELECFWNSNTSRRARGRGPCTAISSSICSSVTAAMMDELMFDTLCVYVCLVCVDVWVTNSQQFC